VGVQPVPGPATLQWQLADPTVARFAGGAAPANVSTVTLEPRRAGSTLLTVTVLVNNQPTNATATMTVNVT
jgi:hypothetical protein